MIFGVSLLLLWSSMTVVLSVLDEYRDCSTWATQGECIANPRFMLSHCLRSCSQSMMDDDRNCEQWANEGECSLNPKYVLFHCPKSCGYSIFWNDWMRKHVTIDEQIPFEEFVDEPEHDGLISVVVSSMNKLALYFDGNGANLKEYSLASPTPFLGVFGISEELLYVLRVVNVVLKHIKTMHEATDSNFESLFSRSNALENRILATIADGYNHDLLSRRLFSLFQELQELTRDFQDSLLELMRNESSENIFPLSLLSTYVLRSSCSSSSSIPSSSQLTETLSIKLSNGIEMPLLGLGTWLLDGSACLDTVLLALQNGYRHIDTAQAYGNEKEVGEAIHIALESGWVQRSDLFIATKLSDSDRYGGYQATIQLVLHQLEVMQLRYFDLYMLHSPFQNVQKQKESWEALEMLYERGLIRSLGVSNFNSRELQDLLQYSRIPPMVLQNKVDPYHVGKQLDNQGDPIIAMAQSHGVAVVAYSPFSAYPFVKRPIYDPIIQQMAHYKSKQLSLEISSAQIILRWMMQHGISVIPRSTQLTHLLSNRMALTEMVSLSDEEMQIIDSLQFLIENSACQGVCWS